MPILEFENLLAGFQAPVVTEGVTVAASQELSVGQVITLDASGQAVASAIASDVYGIMADAVATAAGETKEAVCYTEGEFNARKIILPAGADAVAYRKALSALGITLRNAIPADSQL